MYPLGLSTRETATAIIMAAMILYGSFKLHENGTLWPSVKRIVKAATSPILIVAYLTLLLMSIIGFMIAGTITIPIIEHTLWSFSMLKDTVLEVIFVGFPSLYRGIKASTIRGVFNRVALPEIGFSAILQAYLNIETFPLFFELIMQTMMLFISLILFADPTDEHKLRKLGNIVRAFIGYSVIATSTILILGHISTIVWVEQLRTILLTAWYPMLLVPLIYCMGLHDAIRTARIRFVVSLKSKRAAFLFILFLLPSSKAIRCFPGPLFGKAKKAETILEIRDVIGEYRAWLNMRVQEERGKLKLRDHGKDIADKDGIWQNRAGSEETKRYLIDIAMFMGSVWESGKPPFLQLDDLPYKKPDGIRWSDCKISKSNEYWYAFCLTASGLCYGVRVSPGKTWPDFYESLPGERTETDPSNLVFQEKRNCPNWSYDDNINMMIAE